MFRWVRVYLIVRYSFEYLGHHRDNRNGLAIVHITRTSIPCLNKEVTLAHFQSFGNMPVVKEQLKILQIEIK